MSSRTKDTNRSTCSRDDWPPWERRAAACWTSGFSASASLFTLRWGPSSFCPGPDPRQLLALARAGIQALGEGAQLRRRRIGHGRSVAGRQHLRLEPGERGNGLLRRRPVPGRDPRRARNPLLEPQQIPQGIEIEGQHRIAGDQDPVAGPEKETCPGGMARGGDALPVRKPRNASFWIEGLRRLGDACLRRHPGRTPGNEAHQRPDQPPANRVPKLWQVLPRGQRQLAGVHVHRKVPAPR